MSRRAPLDDTALTDLIHEAALVPTLWADVLDDVSRTIGGRGGFLFGVRDGYVSAISSPHMADIYEHFIAGGWHLQDPRMQRAPMLGSVGFVNDGDMISDDEIATLPIYEEFYRPHGIGYMAGTFIPNPTGDAVAFAFQRHQDDGPVPRAVVTRLDSLRPHLARASLMASRLGFERARAQAEALQALGLPGAVLRRQGQVFAANALFEALMPGLFQDRAQRLVLSDSSADILLAQALTRVGESGVKSIPVAAAPDRLPMVLHLIPVRGSAHDLFTQATALLVVTPVDRAAVPTADVLQGLFDLTPAEARIARGIGEAKTLDALATSLGIARETARGQLKSVLHKTGTARQQELVSLLAGTALPAHD